MQETDPIFPIYALPFLDFSIHEMFNFSKKEYLKVKMFGQFGHFKVSEFKMFIKFYFYGKL